MVGSLRARTYFKVHACLGAYINIPRRNQSTTCITSQTLCRHGSWSKSATALPMAEDLEANLQTTLKLKPHERWFGTGRVQWTIRHSTDKVMGNQQNVWSSQNEVRRRFVGLSSGRRLQEIDVSFGDRRLIDIDPHQLAGIWVQVVENSAVIDIATLCRRSELSGDKRQRVVEPLPHTDNSYLQSSHFDIKV